MKWSWKITELFGIGLFVHATFPLLLIWIAWVYYRETGTVAGAAGGVLFVLMVFVIVVMHELGHALTARRFGIPTRDITLLPIGGVARLERMPEEPKQELLIAVAGPAVNVVLAVLVFLILYVSGKSVSLASLGAMDAGILQQLLWVNVILVLFNALPAFPMDGGRVLRAALALRLEYSRATTIAATIGKGFAVLFGLVFLLTGTNPFLLVIAFFVWMGASGEASMVQLRTQLGGALASDVMITDFVVLQPDDALERGIAEVMAGFQQDFPVVQADRLVGMLMREDLLNALAHRGRTALVREAMRTEFPVAAPNEPVESLFLVLQGNRLRTVPIVRDGVLSGVVTSENIAEFLMLRHALGARRA